MNSNDKIINTLNNALFMETIAMLISFMSWLSISPSANVFYIMLNIGLTTQKLLIAAPVLLESSIRYIFN